jgi:A/G-specific adenine glycosylase
MKSTSSFQISVPLTNIRHFQSTISIWFANNGRRFPWRGPNRSSYEIVIAEILLQRTTAKAVSNRYEDFLLKFPSWNSIVNVNIEIIEEALKPLGLWQQKAAGLKKLSKMMLEREGSFPNSYEALITLPSIGQYIANAILLLEFNIPRPLLDTNMARVLERYFGPRKLADIRYDPYLQELAHQVVDGRDPKKINYGVLDFASIICRPNPFCENCIISDKCLYFSENKNSRNRRVD